MKNSKLQQVLQSIKDPILNSIEDWGIGLVIHRNIDKINSELMLIDAACNLHERSQELDKKHNEILIKYSKKKEDGSPISTLICDKDESGNNIPPYFTRYDLEDETSCVKEITELREELKEVIEFNNIQNNKRFEWNDAECVVELQKIKQSYITDKVERSKLWAKPFDLSRLQIIKLSDIIDFEN